MITIIIPFEFATRRVGLSWHDIQFGIEHQLIAPEFAVEKATSEIASPCAVSKEEIELASSAGGDSIMELVIRLASLEAVGAVDVQAKWLFLVLAWLYESRASIVDPLGAVEEVYSDFGYPREMASLIRYMPMVGPDLGSREQNEARIYANWKEYLEETSMRFPASTER